MNFDDCINQVPKKLSARLETDKTTLSCNSFLTNSYLTDEGTTILTTILGHFESGGLSYIDIGCEGGRGSDEK